MKIQLKHSYALDGGQAKKPTVAQTEYGELCVNFNAQDPSLFIRDNADNIVRVGGDLSLYLSKVDPDTAAGKITFEDGINVNASGKSGAFTDAAGIFGFDNGRNTPIAALGRPLGSPSISGRPCTNFMYGGSNNEFECGKHANRSPISSIFAISLMATEIALTPLLGSQE